MRRLLLLPLALVLAASAAAQPRLQPLGTYATGLFDEGAAEIVDYDPSTKRAFFVNAEAGEIQVLDLSDPAAPELVLTIPVVGTPNSVAIRGGIVAVAVASDTETDPGEVRFYSVKGAFLGAATVGALPDAVAFSDDGRYAVVANEGEPSGELPVVGASDPSLIDPEGTISIIDLGNGVAGLTVATADFRAFNAGGARNAELDASVLLDPRAASVAQDLEPEYVAVVGATAYVTLQEANAIAVVDLATATVTGVFGLGLKDYSQPGNGIDPSDRDGAINIRPVPVLGARQPDALAAFTDNGQTFIVTANEGDARDGNEARVKDLTLDPTAFPNAAALQADDQLGRLEVIPTAGDTDGDGDQDRLVSFGARSFTVFEVTATGLTPVFDSGDAFERITAERFPDDFNSSNDDNDDFDSRSDAKGPEPEAVAVGVVDGRRCAFVGLERIGGVMVYDVTTPSAPAFVEYVSNRDFSADAALPDGSSNPAAGDLGPEAVRFVSPSESPTGQALLLVSNEVSGTVTAYGVGDAAGGLRLALLHNSDGESQLINAGSGQEGFGGVARFASVVERARAQAAADGYASLLVSSGDNFLAGPEYNASVENGTFYDAIALGAIGYDALAIGNHEFDFGPDVLAAFVETYYDERLGGTDLDDADAGDLRQFVSANLVFDREPALARLAAADAIASRRVVTVDGTRVGIIGATTPALRTISSPQDVIVLQDVAQLVQDQIDVLRGQGVGVIVLISHLQGIDQDVALVSQLRGLDIAVAGGGDNLLANADDLLIPGDQAQGAYPLLATDADGATVPVVSTDGGYTYLGRLEVTFDAQGRITAISDDSGPIRVASTAVADGVEPDADLVARVVEPVQAYVASLGRVIGTSEVPLNADRNRIRFQETNLGNLVADAFLATAEDLADDFGTEPADVAIANGGGIRASIRPGDGVALPFGITELNTFDVLPFGNIVVVSDPIRPEVFQGILENGYSRFTSRDGGGGTGRFLQIAGFSVVVDSTRDGGNRVVSATLDDGTRIIDGFEVVSGAPSVRVATADFTFRGGDEFDFGDAGQTALGVTYQQALAFYIEDALGGKVTAAAYPEGGLGRITVLENPVSTEGGAPAAFALAGLYPNPTRGAATVAVTLAEASEVTVEVVDLLGRVVSTGRARLAGGAQTVGVETGAMPSGVYLVRVTAQAGGQAQSATGRLTVVR